MIYRIIQKRKQKYVIDNNNANVAYPIQRSHKNAALIHLVQMLQQFDIIAEDLFYLFEKHIIHPSSFHK